MKTKANMLSRCNLVNQNLGLQSEEEKINKFILQWDIFSTSEVSKA